MTDLVVIILTFNEEVHIARAIDSVKDLAREVLVVDSGSSDMTVEIAKSKGARVLENKFINHGVQFNWALRQLGHFDGFVFRLDADEIVSCQLRESIVEALAKPAVHLCSGFEIERKYEFCGKLLRYGTFANNYVTRIFRYGHGISEERWMDEHISVQGIVQRLRGHLIDCNNKALEDWFAKHNDYSSKEALEYFKQKFCPALPELCAGLSDMSKRKRFQKYRIYYNLPPFFRCFVLFFINYFLRQGFRDGSAGLLFIFLQSFLYRCMVDAKIVQINFLLLSGRMDRSKENVAEFLGLGV